MEEIISQNELWKIINLYNNYEDLRKIINNKDYNIIDTEYYLIKMEWIEKFKKIFHYNGIISSLTKNLSDLKQLKEAPIINHLPTVNIQDKNEIKIIKNKNLIVNSKETGSYYFAPFCLIDPKYYKIIIDGYNIDEKIKCNISIYNGNLIIDLSKNMVEIGVFETPYSYNALYVFQFVEGVNVKEEINNIVNRGLIDYLYQFNITKDMLVEYKELKKDKFNLIKLHLNVGWANSFENTMNQNSLLFKSNYLDISNKKGFKNFGPNSSKLNSIIQILTSIKELYDIFKNPDNSYVKKYNHIYILSSLFFEVINEIEVNEISLKNMDIVIKYLNLDTEPKDIIDYLNIILQNLYNELIIFPANLNPENLRSLNSTFTDKQTSLQIFSEYYSYTYKPSIISNLFNLIIERNVNCNQMYFMSSFQSLPLIVFDIELLFPIQSNQSIIIDIINCFMNYSKVNIQDINQQCGYCGNIHFSNHIIFQTPPYFIIVLNRKKFKDIKIKYYSELDISHFVDQNAYYKKYQLFGIIMEEEGEKYYSVIKNEIKGDFGNKEVWKKFEDEKVSNIILDKDKTKYDKNKFEEVYNQTKSRILFYKGVNY